MDGTNSSASPTVTPQSSYCMVRTLSHLPFPEYIIYVYIYIIYIIYIYIYIYIYILSELVPFVTVELHYIYILYYQN